MPPASPPENTFQQLLGDEVAPTQRIETPDLESLSTTKVIVDQNFLELGDFVDNALYEESADGHSNDASPTYTCDREDAGVYLLNIKAAIHNYIASLYSFHECIVNRLGSYTPDEYEVTGNDLIGVDTDLSPEYAYRAAFLIGLRTDAQHYGFSCLEAEPHDTTVNPITYRITFNESTFREHIGGHERFLHRNSEHREYILRYIGSFHQTVFNSFWEDMIDWLDVTPADIRAAVSLADWQRGGN